MKKFNYKLRSPTLWETGIIIGIYVASAEMWYWWHNPKLTAMELLKNSPNWIWPW